MGNSIYLPAAEDTMVNIHIDDECVSIDAFDLEDYFAEAQTKADEMGTEWQREFPSIFQKHTQARLTAGQAVLLWTAHATKMQELKKSLFLESVGSKKSATSKPKTTKKKK